MQNGSLLNDEKAKKLASVHRLLIKQLCEGKPDAWSTFYKEINPFLTTHYQRKLLLECDIHDVGIFFNEYIYPYFTRNNYEKLMEFLQLDEKHFFQFWFISQLKAVYDEVPKYKADEKKSLKWSEKRCEAEYYGDWGPAEYAILNNFLKKSWNSSHALESYVLVFRAQHIEHKKIATVLGLASQQKVIDRTKNVKRRFQKYLEMST